MLTFLILNSAVFLSALILTAKLFKIKHKIDRLLCFAVLFLAQIIFTEQLLGVFGVMRLSNLVVFNLILLLFIALFSKVKTLAIDMNLSEEFTVNKIIYLCFAFIVGFTFVKSIVTLINAPQGWDSLNYHFTFPVEWLKNYNFINPITICDDPTPTYYPINNCLYYFWLIAPFKSVFLADLGQLPFYIVSFFAVFSICRKLNIGKEFSFYASAMLLMTPNYFKQIGIGYADIMAAALFLVSLNFIVSFYKNRTLINLIISGISLGLLLGVKTVAFTYCGILVLPIICLIVTDKDKSFILKFRNLLLIFMLIVIFGGYGYIRNMILSGNPLFPLNFSIFGKTIFKGVMDASTYRAHWTSEDYNLAKLFFGEGMGAQLILLVVPAMVLFYPILIARRNEFKLSGFISYVLSLPYILYIDFRYIIVQLWTRFLYPFLGCGYITVFYLVEQVKLNKIVIRVIIVICIFASAAEMGKGAELAASFLLSFLIFILLIFSNKWIVLFRKKSVLILLFVLAISFLGFAHMNHEKYLYSRYINHSRFWKDATKAWKWLNDQTKHDNIAYVGRPVPFPLYGSGFKNNVYYVSVNKVQPAQLHYFMNGKYAWGKDFLELHKNLEAEGNYREKADFNTWLRNLEGKKTSYLFVYSLHQTKSVIFPLEDDWAKNNPDKFELSFSNESIHVYKLK